MFDRRFLRYFDVFSCSLTIMLLAVGLLFVFSSTYTPEKPFSIFFKKQLFGAVTGLMIYAVFSVLDLRKFVWLGYFAYFGILALLCYTIFAGWVGMGAQRWISLYVIRFQPSEIAKFGLPVFLGYYFHDQQIQRDDPDAPYPFVTFFYPLAIIFLSFVLILRQPDLGTGLVVLFSGLTMLWFVGLHRKFLVIMSLCALLGTPLLWTFLKPYQQQRILVLFGYGDVRKERYQVEQSKIAIGSGGLLGKGILRGTQNKLGFLPEDHNDFIFSVICEEWGFLGALCVIMMFLALFARLVLLLIGVPSVMNQIIGLGLLLHIMLSCCINIGMVTGLLPVVGIPLPLVSYGISNLWITMASLGWLQNIAIRRFYY